MNQAGSEARPLGAHAVAGGVVFGVWSASADAVWVCVFDEEGREEAGRFRLTRGAGDIHSGFVAGLGPGVRYGLRADGLYDPARSLWFDPAKLLVDPYAVTIDRPYVYDPRLGNAREDGVDTAPLMPRAIVPEPTEALPQRPPLWRPGGFVYELSVRAFTRLHPDIPEAQRGTLGALAHPAVIDHLTRLGVDAVELMPITAWMDERHLAPLGLTNAWGYNPVTFMALDPRLAPGGLAELEGTVAALHQAGIGVILDLVFNHTAESDRHGPTLSLRGLDGPAYFRHAADGSLVNDTGTGNTIDCGHPATRRLVLDSLRHFVSRAGVDGFRFDLAPILGRTERGFEAESGLVSEMVRDPLLGDRVLIAEPWDVGPAGYRLGHFPPPFLEWNDRFRDDVRRFWRGDGSIGAFATRLAGSSDVFPHGVTRSVNFVAAHDGMTLRDVVSYGRKHNLPNGEDNRDGHDDDVSWNNGDEGDSDDLGVIRARGRDMRALLATLFASRGAVMLTAGDEFGRTQHGNNNAYAQDNHITWLDWAARDRELEAFVGQLAALRRREPMLTAIGLLTDDDVAWLTPGGSPMQVSDWETPYNRALAMVLKDAAGELAVLVNGGTDELVFMLPGAAWELRAASATARPLDGGPIAVAGRSVTILGRSLD